MKKIIALLAVVSVLSLSAVSMAKPEKGWHKGVYILGGVGSLNVDHDTNVVTNAAFGKNRILGYGLTIGDNFLDFLAAELQARYGTDTAGGNKEHAANFDLNIKYSLILDALTRMEKVRILPYIKAGGGLFGAAVPSNDAGNNRFGVYGPSADFGAGVEVLLLKKLYVGADFTENLVWLKEKTNAAGVRILAGGFDPQDSFFGYVGVHF